MLRRESHGRAGTGQAASQVSLGRRVRHLTRGGELPRSKDARYPKGDCAGLRRPSSKKKKEGKRREKIALYSRNDRVTYISRSQREGRCAREGKRRAGNRRNGAIVKKGGKKGNILRRGNKGPIVGTENYPEGEAREERGRKSASAMRRKVEVGRERMRRKEG